MSKIKKTLKRLIQAPLKFHHQDIHESLETQQRLHAFILGEIQDLNLSINRIEDRLMARLDKIDKALERID